MSWWDRSYDTYCKLCRRPVTIRATMRTDGPSTSMMFELGGTVPHECLSVSGFATPQS